MTCRQLHSHHRPIIVTAWNKTKKTSNSSCLLEHISQPFIASSWEGRGGLKLSGPVGVGERGWAAGVRVT